MRNEIMMWVKLFTLGSGVTIASMAYVDKKIDTVNTTLGGITKDVGNLQSDMALTKDSVSRIDKTLDKITIIKVKDIALKGEL
jgi:hypothetical protein